MELGEGVGTMRPNEEYTIYEIQPKARLFEGRVKKILFMEANE